MEGDNVARSVLFASYLCAYVCFCHWTSGDPLYNRFYTIYEQLDCMCHRQMLTKSAYRGLKSKLLAWRAAHAFQKGQPIHKSSTL